MSSSMSSSLRAMARPTRCCTVARHLHTQGRQQASSPSQQSSPPPGQNALQEVQGFLGDVMQTNYPSQAFARRPQITIKPNTFIRPIQLSRQFQSKQAIRPKRSMLGPGREARQNDVFLQLSIDPRLECDNAVFMSNFVTTMGKIKTRAETGLTTRSQRFLTKAIKRARMMGAIPWLSRRTL